MRAEVTHYTTYTVEDGDREALWMQDSAERLKIYQTTSLEVKKGTPEALALLKLFKKGVEILESGK